MKALIENTKLKLLNWLLSSAQQSLKNQESGVLEVKRYFNPSGILYEYGGAPSQITQTSQKT